MAMVEEKPTTGTKSVSNDVKSHHHHSWIGRHFCTRNLKKFGALGIVLFILHILFHIVEILLIPTILVWLGLN